MGAGLPSAFRLSLTSFYGRSYSLVLREKKLIYEATRPTKKLTREPSEVDWNKFWKKSVKLKIWLWDSQYIDGSSSDGTNWSVNIEIGNLKVKSYGSNIKPDNFSEFIIAVSELVPGLEFVVN